MKLGLLAASAAAAVAVLSSGASAHAATITTYTLSNVGLTNGVGGSADGTLSGTFTYNGTTDMLVSANITVGGGVAPAPYTGGGYDYTFGIAGADSTDFNGTNLFELYGAGGQQLELAFSGALNGTGADALTTASNEYEASLGTRNIVPGSATLGSAAAPEPSSIALLGTGLLGLGGLLRRRLA